MSFSTTLLSVFDKSRSAHSNEKPHSSLLEPYDTITLKLNYTYQNNRNARIVLFTLSGTHAKITPYVKHV